MSALFDLQRRFQAHVLGTGVPIPEAVGTPDADAGARLRVYANAYRLRLLEVLGNDFTGLRALIGEVEFERLGSAYVDAYPSRHFNLRWYGAALSDFLGSNAPWTERPALAEMARFEWNLTLVFDERDQPVVGLPDVAALPPEHWPDMQPRLTDAIRRQACEWNTGAIRSAVDRGVSVPELQRLSEPEVRIVWRHQRDVRHRALEIDEAAAIEALSRGATFGDLCELLCEWHAADDVALRAAQLLKRWIGDEWLTALGPG